MFSILHYIIKNNPWYKIPLRCLQAFFYQCHKRLSPQIKSKNLFNGKKILLFPHNPISSAFIYTDIPDKAEIEALRALADEQTIFLDIGANMGAYSLLLMDKVKKVFAFEAHPITANLCKMNFLLNAIPAEQVITMAVSSNNEPKYFSNFSEGSPVNKAIHKTKESICVNAITLDEFIQQQQFSKDTNFLLKVDVEGFEHEVFQGAKTFLTTSIVKGIIFEVFSTKNDEIMSFLNKLGYKTAMLNHNNMFAYLAYANKESLSR